MRDARNSWNEIENRAEQFAARWAGETYEKGESQSFSSETHSIFGVDKRGHGAFFCAGVLMIFPGVRQNPIS